MEEEGRGKRGGERPASKRRLSLMFSAAAGGGFLDRLWTSSSLKWPKMEMTMVGNPIIRKSKRNQAKSKLPREKPNNRRKNTPIQQIE